MDRSSEVAPESTVQKMNGLGDRLVSVIVPVFNTKAYLRQCLDSLIAQTLDGIEIICVDNGSTDGSYDWLMAYAQDHAQVIVMQHAGGRQGGARNAGIEIAKGEYIGFVDSDDFVAPDMYQTMVHAIEDGSAEVAICNIQLFIDGTGYGPHTLPSDLLSDVNSFSIERRPRLLRNLTICNRLFLRRFINEHHLRFPEGVFHQDQFFVIAALAEAQSIVTVPDSCYFYRKKRSGSVSEYRGNNCMHVFQVMERVSDFVDQNQVSDTVKTLIDEAKVLKYLHTYRSANRESQRPYFDRMKREFRPVSLGTTTSILSSTERREYRAVVSGSVLTYNLYLYLREIYGWLREKAVRLGVLNRRGRVSSHTDLVQ